MFTRLGLSENFTSDYLASLTPDHGDEIKDLYQDFEDFRLSGLENEAKSRSLLERCNLIENDIVACLEDGSLCDVSERRKEIFAASSALKAYILLDRQDPDCLEDTLRTLDLVLLVGVPLPGWNLLPAASDLHDLLGQNEHFEEDTRTLGFYRPRLTSSRTSVSDEDEPCDNQSNVSSNGSDDEGDGEDSEEEDDDNEVPVEDCPSLQTFIQDYFETDMAVKMLNCMSGWAAMVKWKYLGYLNRVAGHRTVPVEMGDYSRGGKTRLVKFSKYLNDMYLGKRADQIGYMAQHQLLNQEPRLRRDVIVPDYCSVTDVEEPLINCWLGPHNSVSPLHYDPQPNILAQVFGTKYILLYPVENTPFLYPRRDRLFNTSQVDIPNRNYYEFPLFDNAQGIRCSLKAGEMLFIPAGCWHFVEAASDSFSVNFFF